MRKSERKFKVEQYKVGKAGGGWIAIALTKIGLSGISLPRQSKAEALRSVGGGAIEKKGRDKGKNAEGSGKIFGELRGYFEGRVKEFKTKLDMKGVGEFDRKVLEVTRKIPYGERRSYSWIAERLGNAGLARAVGGALGRNPLPIVIPCHRVIRKGGKLGGFSGGIKWKRRLLGLERNSIRKGKLGKNKFSR
jgi:methylated-DNA-[protein]-cysteine S-methyltransferase